ncbi:MAG TPA: universal stress protein [Candidatus Binatia bacterium]|nr:universal stress protein [Candidatus Binatia bacterium]
MKILIGIDDSPQSREAMKFLREAAWARNAEILVLSSVEISAYVLVEPAGAAVYDSLQRDQRRAHERLVTDAVRELTEAGLAARGKVEEGDARDALVRAAETERVDLLVVGSHGRTGLAKLLLGSVASHVVTHAPCSVVVVKSRAPKGGPSS